MQVLKYILLCVHWSAWLKPFEMNDFMSGMKAAIAGKTTTYKVRSCFPESACTVWMGNVSLRCHKEMAKDPFKRQNVLTTLNRLCALSDLTISHISYKYSC